MKYTYIYEEKEEKKKKSVYEKCNEEFENESHTMFNIHFYTLYAHIQTVCTMYVCVYHLVPFDSYGTGLMF